LAWAHGTPSPTACQVRTGGVSGSPAPSSSEVEIYPLRCPRQTTGVDSVTRLTLTSVFGGSYEHELLQTRTHESFRVAVKICCRSRRISGPGVLPLTAFHWSRLKVRSLHRCRPLRRVRCAIECVMAPNFPFGSALSSCGFHGLPAHVSALRGIRPSGRCDDGWRCGPACRCSRRVSPAFASETRYPPGSWPFLTVGLLNIPDPVGFTRAARRG
jgi:hypothetical protein